MSEEDETEPQPEGRGRMSPMTPEMRRFLGAGRSLSDKETRPAVRDTEKPAEIVERAPEIPKRIPPPKAQAPRDEATPAPATKAAAPSRLPVTGASFEAHREEARAKEFFKIGAVVALILLILGVFYLGRKIDYWRYRWHLRKMTEETARKPDKFPQFTGEQLIEQALIAEKAGRANEAVEKLLAAKSKSPQTQGLLLRAAIILFRHHELDLADRLLQRAIAIGENADGASVFRGLIAMKRKDYLGAEKSFDDATRLSPFLPQPYFEWAEALRLDRKPKEAIARYQQAALRAASASDEAVCQYKVRITRIEMGEADPVRQELEKRRAAGGDLSVDWLMTAAALDIRDGKFGAATDLINKARANPHDLMFLACANDPFFREVADRHPELAPLLRPEGKTLPLFSP
ncbi:MAG: hypothetical protein M3R59_11670 [Verrucomicrobiota bacterium]|nr:hypothetical protein [Verrucomicrobiota bacterium]